MKYRFRPHEVVVCDGRWAYGYMPLLQFTHWHKIWYRDFAIEVNVLGHWTPAHVVLAGEIVPKVA